MAGDSVAHVHCEIGGADQVSEKTYTADELYSRLAWEDDCYELFAEGVTPEDIEDEILAEAWHNLRCAYEEMHYFETEFMAELEEARDRQLRPYADEKYHFPTIYCD